MKVKKSHPKMLYAAGGTSPRLCLDEQEEVKARAEGFGDYVRVHDAALDDSEGVRDLAPPVPIEDMSRAQLKTYAKGALDMTLPVNISTEEQRALVVAKLAEQAQE